MMHRVVKSFSFSEDGFTLIDLDIGDERDFGCMAEGLVSEGWIEPVEQTDDAIDDKPNASIGRGRRK